MPKGGKKKGGKKSKKDLIRSSVTAVSASVNQLKLTGEKKEEDNSDDDDDDDDELAKLPSFCFVDNGVTKCLRAIEIDDAMVSNHTTDSYHARIKAILN